MCIYSRIAITLVRHCMTGGATEEYPLSLMFSSISFSPSCFRCDIMAAGEKVKDYGHKMLTADIELGHGSSKQCCNFIAFSLSLLHAYLYQSLSESANFLFVFFCFFFPNSSFTSLFLCTHIANIVVSTVHKSICYFALSFLVTLTS